MINVQTLYDIILVLAVLVGLAAVLTAVMLAAPSVSRPGQKPHGGTRRDLQPEPQPQPDAEEERERELVLL